MQNRNILLIGLALFLGVIAVLLANSYFSGVEEQQASIAEQQKLTQIVVATQPMEFGAPLTTQNIRLQAFPAASVPEGAFTSVPDALRDNRVALRPIVPGEPILASKVSGTDGRATLAALLPDGFRAISIPIDNVRGVAGFALPGTTVDVLLLRQIEGDGADAQDQRADVILENVQILAIDQNANDKDGKPNPGGVATLALSPTDAQRIAIANRMGTLQLTLRKIEPALADADAADQPKLAKTVTSRNLGLPRIVIGGKNRGGGGGGGGGGSSNVNPFQGLAPLLASINPPRTTTVVAPGGAPVIVGPAMTVVRGTEPTNYSVGTLGGSR